MARLVLLAMTSAVLGCSPASIDSPAVDMAYLQLRHFSSPHAGTVEGHEYGALLQVPGGIDKLAYFLLTQYRRQPPLLFGIRQILSELVTF